MQNKFKRIAIKIGSNVLAKADGSLNVARITNLVEQIATLQKSGTEVIVVSSLITNCYLYGEKGLLGGALEFPFLI